MTAIALTGLSGTRVRVEAAVSSQLPGMAIIGLPDTALAEAKQRVRLAALATGCALSDRFIVINLSPAALPKHGSGFDLAIALAALAASGQLPEHRLETTAHLGELGLGGELRRPVGLLTSVIAARDLGLRRVMVPAGSAREGSLVPGIEVIAVQTLRDAVAWHRGEPGKWWVADGREPASSDEPSHTAIPTNETGRIAGAAATGEPTAADRPDIADVVGQTEAVEALLVAAAGRHHMSMVGPPGAGKTLLASRLPTLLPDLSDSEALLASSIASLHGRGLCELHRRPPFESPHHTASPVSIIGGGDASGVRPGAVTRASFGVLFLDEAPEFPRSVLDALRQPLESGIVEIHRARLHASMPARVQLVLAANPCPCGQADSTEAASPCRCTPALRTRYLARLSGPLMDRVDVRLSVRRVASLRAHAAAGAPRPTSAELRRRVGDARAAMAERLRGTPWRVNAEVSGAWLRESAAALPARVTTMIDQALARGVLTARGYDRTLRIAWTICDLAGRTSPDRDDIAEALALRGGVSG